MSSTCALILLDCHGQPMTYRKGRKLNSVSNRDPVDIDTMKLDLLVSVVVCDAHTS